MIGKLTFVNRDGRHRTHPILDDRVYVLGRGDRVDIRVPDNSVSRSHCILEKKGEGFSLFDLTSSNGTLLNGQRLGDTTPLKDGDRIQIGESCFHFELVPDSERWALFTEVPDENEYDPMRPGYRFASWRDPALAIRDSSVIPAIDPENDTQMIEVPDEIRAAEAGGEFAAAPEEESAPGEATGESLEGAEAAARLPLTLAAEPTAEAERGEAEMPGPEAQEPSASGPGGRLEEVEGAPPLNQEEEALARQCVELGFLPEEKVSLARMQREMDAPGKPFGLYLVDRELITWEQLKELLRWQQGGFQEEAEKRWTKRENVLFGKLAVRKEFITPEQLEECLAAQQETTPRRNIGEIMIGKGYMTRHQVDAVLRAQQREVLRCVDCDAAYLTHNLEPGRRLRCKTCGAILTVPPAPVDPRKLEGLSLPPEE